MLDRYFPIYALIFAVTLVLTALLERRLIPIFAAKAKQPIYKEGPSWHIKKSGTPTMGGLAFVIASVITLVIGALAFLFEGERSSFLNLLISLSFALANAFIGMTDDMVKLKRKENAGLSPFQKIALQFIISALFLAARHFILGADTALKFADGEIELGWLYYPLAMFILLGLINSANLTDGIDGLASSVAFAIGVSLFYLSAALNPSMTMIASAIMGAAIGFLLFNLHPAKIFMGDTGSLYLGALVSSAAFILENMLLMLFIAGVYVIEGFSVVLQVFFFKLTGKRIFKMAPLHHHLEKSGYSENKICLLAIFATFILSIPVYIFYLP